ncbi:DUF6766 family protein [Ktedonospora formicarum]|uniref:Transmembrane protein n=1 Tax=Ktedonospora formicarum TaxID=2778364 RepID=A0A8J3MV31_9CHLR|nr:DUF6766 family protein [Ktedonospora formicarum]GHO48880.1 hypothetical protein KSX_70430 [Ktedonospora formicarum]
MRRIFYENGLSIVLFALFLACVIGQSLTGYQVYNQDQQEHHQPQVKYETYLVSGYLLESLAENWESEFLQMGLFVLLTAFLFQKGSPESNPLEKQEPSHRGSAESTHTPSLPWPVRRGGIIFVIYQHSLTIALLLLFAISFVLHAIGGAKAYCQEQMEHGNTHCPDALHFVGTATFWFQSLQNWQSEFLSIGMIIVLAIFLRQKGSSQSKEVASPHGKTGT